MGADAGIYSMLGTNALTEAKFDHHHRQLLIEDATLLAFIKMAVEHML
jgi:hypothetical protein